MTEKLKPCPFCGGKAELHTIKDYNGVIIATNVYCIVCGGRGGSFSNTDNAIRIWNGRFGNEKQ